MRVNSALRFYRENHYFLKLAMPSKNFISGVYVLKETPYVRVFN